MKINALEWSTNRLFRAVVCVSRWAMVMLIGVALWLIGLVVLGVPADLPPWRHVVGAAMLATACFCWARA